MSFLATISTPDLINGIFESCGGFFIALSIYKLHHEKIVKGVSWPHVAFFSSWGIWNLYFYPHLDQWLSFWGGLLLVISNCIWLGQIFYYNWCNRQTLLARGGFVAPPSDEGVRIIAPGEFSFDGGMSWHRGNFDDAIRHYTKTPRYRHSDK